MQLKIGDKEYEFPLFILATSFRQQTAKQSITIENPITLTLPENQKGLAVFSDRDAAEQFIDENALSHKPIKIDSKWLFALILKAVGLLKEPPDLVVFDPYRQGLNMPGFFITDLIDNCNS